MEYLTRFDHKRALLLNKYQVQLTLCDIYSYTYHVSLLLVSSLGSFVVNLDDGRFGGALLWRHQFQIIILGFKRESIYIYAVLAAV